MQLPSDFARHEGRYVFTSDSADHAIVNIDGQNISLTKTKSTHRESPDVQLGDREVVWYRAEDVDVRVDYTVTATCPGNNKACGVTSYEAVISIKRGKATKTVAAKGVCSISHAR